MFKSIILYFLRVLSKKILKKYNPDVIGITGSMGKTSAKEAIALVLSSHFIVRKNYKNYNNEFGLPLTIIGVDKSPKRSIFGWIIILWRAFHLICVRSKKYPEILVLEMGADKPGDIKYLTDIAPCKVGVLTNISHAHTEFFKTIKRISQEKRVIISHLSHDGFAVLNTDSDMVMENINKTKAETFTYGFKDGSDFQASDLKIIKSEATGWPEGLNFKVLHKGNVVPVYLKGAVSEGMVSASLVALTIGNIFGINLVDCARSLESFSALPGHMKLIDGIKNTLIIDDTYNSSPDAVRSALKALSEVGVNSSAEKYAVLGDMLELGTETGYSHREIGFRVAEAGVDFLITVGEASKETASAAKEAGIDEHNIAMFAGSEEAGRFLQDKIKKGDVILVKGSRSIHMEKIVKEIMAEPLEAENLLV